MYSMAVDQLCYLDPFPVIVFEVYASTFIYIRRVVSASCDRAVILSLDKNLQFFSTPRGKKINHFFRTTHCNRDEGCSKFLVC